MLYLEHEVREQLRCLVVLRPVHSDVIILSRRLKLIEFQKS